jgi:hypothetical protein
VEGWIKLHRKFVNWEWFTDSKTSHLFLYLLLSANHEDKNWRGQNIKRGQLITGRKSLSEKTGLSEQVVRTSLNKLKSTNEITIKTTNKNSVITVLNYDLYQNKTTINQQSNQQITNKQPTTNQQITTTKNDNNIKNDKNDKNIDYVYSLYPAKCPIKNSSTGKGQKSKDKIKTLLKTKSKEQIEESIIYYLKECQKSKTWLKNFNTILNDLPEPIKEIEIIYFKKLIDNDGTYRQLEKPKFDVEYKDYLNKIKILPKKPLFGKLITVGT